jgi:hypothetical protein
LAAASDYAVDPRAVAAAMLRRKDVREQLFAETTLAKPARSA